MPTIKGIKEGRAVDGGHAIEVEFVLQDGSSHILKIPYENIPHAVHAISASASVAETAQKAGATGRPQFSAIVPYRATHVRTGTSPDGQVVAEFATGLGPVQVAMPSSLAQDTIERLKTALGDLGKPGPKPS